MKEAYPQVSLDRICCLFGVSRQAHYKSSKQKNRSFMEEDLVLQMVSEIRKTHPCIGTRKLMVLMGSRLKVHGINIGRDALFALLRDNGMLIRKRRRKWITTWSNHPYRKYSNLIRDIESQKPNEIWVSDMTYLPTKAGHLYLSLITDAYSRKIVGFDIADNMESINALQALRMAIKSLPEGCEGLIHHSDRGSQYCCHEYVKELLKNNIGISMTENGDPLENAVAERINGIVKNEYLVFKTITNKLEAKKALMEAIIAYNCQRPHMSIGYKTPENVHENPVQANRAWKSYYRKKELVNL